MEEINAAEEKLLRDVVGFVWKNVSMRCQKKKMSESATSASLSSIQDFLTNLNVDGDGVEGEIPQ